MDATHDCDISVCGFNKKEIIGIPGATIFVSKEITTCLSAHECVLDLHNNHYYSKFAHFT